MMKQNLFASGVTPSTNTLNLKEFLINLASRFTTKQTVLGVVMMLRRLIYTTLWKYLGLPIVTRDKLASDSQNYQTLHFGCEESILAKPPITLDEIPKLVQPSLGQFTFKKPFVSEVPNAQLLGSAAVGLDRNKRIIMDTVFPDYDDGNPGFIALPIRTLIRKQIVETEAEGLDTVCSLVTKWSQVYSHWLLECLPRIEGSEYYHQKTGIKPLLVIDSNPKPWQIESLNLLGYGAKDYIEWTRTRVNVKKLIVPSFRRQSVWPEPAACAWLRQRLIKNLPPLENKSLSFSPRILISRAKATGRQIINEDEVMEVLAPLGFARYVLEEMSFADEVRLFSQAEVIMGIHGSGLTNLILSEKKPIVIDLFDSWYTGVFFKMCASLGCQYACIQCQPVSTDSSKRIKGNDNMIVDISKLKKLVEMALLQSQL